MDFKKYLSKGHIEKVRKNSQFPNDVFIELLIHDYKTFSRILELNKNFVLKGGAAAQLYIPLEEQRTSVDLDLVTSMSQTEVNGIMKKLGAEEYKPKKPSKELPLRTYLINIASVITPKQHRQVKIDVIFEKLSDYKVKNVNNIELFILKLDFDMPTISKGSLIADKLLTLAKKSVGIRKEDKLKEVPKQIYDLIKLCEHVSLEDLNDLLFSFEKIAKSELEYRKLECSTNEIIEHIEETLGELCSIDVKNNDIKNNLNRFTSAYLNKISRPTTEDWVIGGLKLKFLLNGIKNNIISKKSSNEIFNELMRIHKDLTNIDKMEIEQKRRYREKLVEEVRDKLPNWKHLISRKEERMFLELGLVEDDTKGLFKRYIFKVLNREKFEKITNLTEKNRDDLRELFRKYFEKKLKLDELVVAIKKACPQKNSYLCKFIANTEISKLESLARLEELKARKEKYCYVELSRNSVMCPDCRRLIDGKVFKIETLEKNIYANYGKKPSFWKPAVPLHPNCNHKIRPLTPSEKKKIKVELK